jgi:hypothetical protein
VDKIVMTQEEAEEEDVKNPPKVHKFSWELPPPS